MARKIGRNLIVILLLFIFLITVSENVEFLWDLFDTNKDDSIRHRSWLGLQIVIWLCGAFFLKEIINFIYLKRYAKLGDAKPKLIKDLLVIFIFFIDGLLIFKLVLHQPLAGLWITSGTLALVLGFALRNIIMDLFSGIAVNIEKPYQIGDWIEIHQRFASESLVGQVTDISWRATHILTETNVNVVIPNSMMTTMVVTTNFWHRSMPTRFEVNLTLDFSVSSERAKRILYAGAMQAMQEQGFVKEKLPQVLIDKTDEMGVVYKVRYWINPWQGISPSAAKDKMFTFILGHLEAAGLTLAYPKEDVYQSIMPSRQLDLNNIEDRSKLLSRIEIFSILTTTEIELLSKNMVKHTFRAEQLVVAQGEEGNSMFVIFEGLLEVSVLDNDTNIKLAVLAPSDYFGEMSLLTGERRSASLHCITASIVYEIKFIDFMHLLSRREEIADQIALKIADRRQVNSDLIESVKNQASAMPIDGFRASLVKRIKHFFTLVEADTPVA